MKFSGTQFTMYGQQNQSFQIKTWILFCSTGHDHDVVVKLRWLSGSAATILCYPVLMHLGISSHFLPWLPAAIGIYSIFGAVLGFKKNKVPVCTFYFHISREPYQHILILICQHLKLVWKQEKSFSEKPPEQNPLKKSPPPILKVTSRVS